MSQFEDRHVVNAGRAVPGPVEQAAGLPARAAIDFGPYRRLWYTSPGELEHLENAARVQRQRLEAILGWAAVDGPRELAAPAYAAAGWSAAAGPDSAAEYTTQASPEHDPHGLYHRLTEQASGAADPELGRPYVGPGRQSADLVALGAPVPQPGATGGADMPGRTYTPLAPSAAPPVAEEPRDITEGRHHSGAPATPFYGVPTQHQQGGPS